MFAKLPPAGRRTMIALITICALLLFAGFFIHRHETFAPDEHGKQVLGIESMPGFYALFGFAACNVIVLLARGLRRFLMRAEDYYER